MWKRSGRDRGETVECFFDARNGGVKGRIALGLYDA
jgi:hypothetical protein